MVSNLRDGGVVWGQFGQGCAKACVEGPPAPSLLGSKDIVRELLDAGAQSNSVIQESTLPYVFEYLVDQGCPSPMGTRLSVHLRKSTVKKRSIHNAGILPVLGGEPYVEMGGIPVSQIVQPLSWTLASVPRKALPL